VREIVAQVFVLNIVLASLATATVLAPSPQMTAGALLLGALLVTGLLYRFASGKRVGRRMP
jgi:hypothetical protein